MRSVQSVDAITVSAEFADSVSELTPITASTPTHLGQCSRQVVPSEVINRARGAADQSIGASTSKYLTDGIVVRGSAGRSSIGWVSVIPPHHGSEFTSTGTRSAIVLGFALGPAGLIRSRGSASVVPSQSATTSASHEFFELARTSSIGAVDPLATLNHYARSIGDRFLRGVDATSTASGSRSQLRRTALPACVISACANARLGSQSERSTAEKSRTRAPDSRTRSLHSRMCSMKRCGMTSSRAILYATVSTTARIWGPKLIPGPMISGGSRRAALTSAKTPATRPCSERCSPHAVQKSSASSSATSIGRTSSSRSNDSASPAPAAYPSNHRRVSGRAT